MCYQLLLLFIFGYLYSYTQQKQLTTEMTFSKSYKSKS